LTIVNEATAALDTATQAAVFNSIKDMTKDSGLVWVNNEIGEEQKFDRIFIEDRGRVTEQVSEGAAKPPPAPVEEPAAAEDGGTLGQEVILLSKIPLFSGMERSKLKLLAFTSERQDFEEGQILFKQGDAGDKAFVIVEGSVNVIVDTPDGPQVLSNPGRGDVIGELALLCEEPRTATVKANQPLTVLSISGDVFFKLIQENPEVSMALTRIVAKRLVQTMKQMS
jgi:energy-coupling factor transporter ATP-binding protein EcfA2